MLNHPQSLTRWATTTLSLLVVIGAGCSDGDSAVEVSPATGQRDYAGEVLERSLDDGTDYLASNVEVTVQGDLATVLLEVTLGVGHRGCSGLPVVYSVNEVLTIDEEGAGSAEPTVEIDASGVSCDGGGIGEMPALDGRLTLSVTEDRAEGTLTPRDAPGATWSFVALPLEAGSTASFDDAAATPDVSEPTTTTQPPETSTTTTLPAATIAETSVIKTDATGKFDFGASLIGLRDTYGFDGLGPTWFERNQADPGRADLYVDTMLDEFPDDFGVASFSGFLWCEADAVGVSNQEFIEEFATNFAETGRRSRAEYLAVGNQVLNVAQPFCT